ncbi:MAG TPA: aldo/keto reductase, partial [Methanoregulaceae archaeon]|nr:aldo/keto reductase [Methanoregulaceae archaeon]
GWYGMRLMGGQGGGRADASLCRNCWRSAQVCPQKIPIPDELKKVNRTLGGIRTQLMLPFIRMILRRKKNE